MTEKIGYWKNDAGTIEGKVEIGQHSGTMNTTEGKAVVKFIEASKIHDMYRGCSICRVCGKENGSEDLISPDGNFIFPEGYLHYITCHSVRPPENFIAAAIRWVVLGAQ